MRRAPTDRRTGAPLLAVLVLGAAAGAAPLRAQTVEAGALAFNAQHRVLFAGTVAERSGVFVGGQGALLLGPLRVRLSGIMGSLGAGEDAAIPKTDVRSTTVAVLVRVAPWLEAGAEMEGRRFEADAGVTTWQLYGGAVRLTPPMGVPGLAGFAEVSFFATATAQPQEEKMSPAFRGTVGVSYSPAGKVEARLGYRFERFDFEAAGTTPARLEQFRGIVAGLGLRIGR